MSNTKLVHILFIQISNFYLLRPIYFTVIVDITTSTAFEIGVIFSSVMFTTGEGVGNVDSPTAHKWALDSSLVQLLRLFLATG